jgi:hypothetical protein
MMTNRLCQTIEAVDWDGLIKEPARIEKALLGKAIINCYQHLLVGSRWGIIAGPMMSTEEVVIERQRCKDLRDSRGNRPRPERTCRNRFGPAAADGLKTQTRQS